MKIVCISDTHENHLNLKVPDGDILIHAGDVCFSHGQWTEIEKTHYLVDFNKWLGKLPHKHKIVIGGNHDFLFEQIPELPKTILTNAHYLHNESIKIDDFNIFGSPYQPWFYNWAFNQKEEIKETWEKIPLDTNILVTHGPPLGILDTSKSHKCGCPHLAEKIKELESLKLHVFGHIHQGYGTEGKNRVLFANASVVNSKYILANDPIVVNI